MSTVRTLAPGIWSPGAVLCVLFAINLINFFDRQIFAAVTEPLRREWGLTDTQLGWLVTAFTLLYALVGLPLGDWPMSGGATGS